MCIRDRALLAILSSCNKAEPDLYNNLKSVNKLVLAQMTVSSTMTIDDPKLSEATGLKDKIDAIMAAMKIGDRKAAFTCSTYISAYIDMSQLQPGDIHIDHGAKIVDITLPPILTELRGRDINLTELHYRVNGLRSEISAEERAALKAAMGKALRERINDDPRYKSQLVSMATDKARGYFETLLSHNGYCANITFRNA